MSVTKFLSLILATSCLLLCNGRRINSTRGKLELKKTPSIPHTKMDTIYEGFSKIKIAGYEKAQNSSTESFFVINESDFYLKGINLSIEYLNSNSEQLHQNTMTINCDIPPLSTRSLTVKSWDRQHLWYYHGTQGKHNNHCNPFDVRIRVNYLITLPDR